MTDQRMLFPEPAKNRDAHQTWIGEAWRKHTFTTYPQEGAIGFPFLESTAAKEPLSRSAVLDTACDIVICRWIRRRSPSSKVLSHLVPYEYVRNNTIRSDRVDHSHFTSSTFFVTCWTISFVSFPSNIRVRV